MKLRILLIITIASIVIGGCGGPKTTNIDIRNDDGKAVMGLDYRDFDQAASEMIQSLVVSGALKKQGGGRYVVATGRIVNDTMQRIDTDQLMAKIEEEAKKNGCTNAYLNSFSFHAVEFYKKIGYRVFGELKDFPRVTACVA